MNILSFYKRKIINSVFLCAIFALGVVTLLFHNAAIRDETLARRMEEKRDTLERVALSREAAYLHFSLLSLRNQALAMGFVPVSDPRFVRRGEEKPPLAIRDRE